MNSYHPPRPYGWALPIYNINKDKYGRVPKPRAKMNRNDAFLVRSGRGKSIR